MKANQGFVSLKSKYKSPKLYRQNSEFITKFETNLQVSWNLYFYFCFLSNSVILTKRWNIFKIKKLDRNADNVTNTGRFTGLFTQIIIFSFLLREHIAFLIIFTFLQRRIILYKVESLRFEFIAGVYKGKNIERI